MSRFNERLHASQYKAAMFQRLEALGISRDDAEALRRIAMTLQKWYELECGNSNDYKSWTITRGTRAALGKGKYTFAHDENGKPFLETHLYSENAARYTPIPDKERGAYKRARDIMARYPTLSIYFQTDPRGASVYVLAPGDVPEGKDISAYYSRGVAVHK